MPTIAEIAGGEDFSVLLNTVIFIDENVDGSDLAGALSGTDDLTVFAPNNAAFGQLATDLGFAGDTSDPDAVVQFFAANVPADTLKSIVEYHVLAGTQRAADIAASDSLTTLQGGTITPDLPTLTDNEPDLIDPSLIAMDIEASNGVVHVIDRVLLPIDLPDNDASTFTEIVLESGTGFDTNANDFDLLREAVVATGLADTLNDAEADLTVFAPNDAAFVGLAQNLGYEGTDEAEAFNYIVDASRLLSGGQDPTGLIQTILLYHVSGESLQASQVLQGDPIATLAGAGLELQPDGTSLIDNEPDLDDPSLIATDIQAANGVLHVLDGVLIPADLLQSDGSNDVDFIIGDDSSETILTGQDDDFVDGKGGRDIISGGSGDDVLLGGDGNDVVFGNAGDDTMRGDAGNDELYSGIGDDRTEGGDGNDLVFGGEGNDRLTGNAGDDTVFGGSGDDTIFGGEGDDRLFANAGDDEVHGRAGDDIVFAGSGDDLLTGGEGDDRMFSKSGDDTAYGGHGRDLIFGGEGDDLLSGGGGRDTVFGGSGDDTLLGGDQDDQLFANAGDDEVTGGSGNDTLFGGIGDDTLSGGEGNDTMYGGTGDDTFVFEAQGGNDRVSDFSIGDDVIDLTAFGLADFAAVQSALTADGNRSVIDIAGTQITLIGVQAQSLDADDFLL